MNFLQRKSRMQSTNFDHLDWDQILVDTSINHIIGVSTPTPVVGQMVGAIDIHPKKFTPKKSWEPCSESRRVHDCSL